MRLFGWFRFPTALRPRMRRRPNRLRRRSCQSWESPGRQVPGIESLETRWMLSVSLAVSNPAAFPEGDSGTSNMVFVVTRSGDLTPEVKVDFTTVDGTAIAGTDYTFTSGTLDFASGVNSLPVNVPVIGNTIFQSNRSFTLALSNASETAGAPTFTGPQTFGVASGPSFVTVADINGDGLKDLIVTSISSNTVSVLMNNTAPGSTTPSFLNEVTFSAGTNPQKVTVADINGDGKPDLIVANQASSYVSVLLNNTTTGATTPSFLAQQTFDTGAFEYGVATADINGDGLPDLIVGHGGAASSVSVLLNTTPPGATTASFATQQTFAVGAGSDSIAAADLNGDGKQDLIVTNFTDGTVSVLMNETTTGAAAPSFAGQQTFTAGTNPTSVAVADINGDGLKDLVVANYGSNSISVFLDTTTPGTTTASFAAQQTFAAGTKPTSVTVADLNGDGKLDVLVSNDDSVAATVLLDSTSPGATTVSFAAPQTFTAGGVSFSATAADLNGDGTVDMIVTNFSAGTVSVLLNTTSLPLATPVNFLPQTTIGTGKEPRSVAVGDVNGDGKPDLIIADRVSGDVEVFLNTTAPGATTPSFGAAQTFAVGSQPYSVALADVNGDGLPDIVVANDAGGLAGSVSVLLNLTAPGAATAIFATQVTFAAGQGPEAMTIADVNHDGEPDVIVANGNGHSVDVFLNQTPPGATTPSFARQTFDAGGRVTSVATADINGDGNPDIVVGNVNNDSVEVLMNQTAPGATTSVFSSPQTFAVGSHPFGVAVADLNGDGKPDLIAVNDNDNTVSVLLNITPAGATTASFATQQTFATGGSSALDSYKLAVGDLNGDGKPDLVSMNYTSGTVSVLANQTTAGSTTLSFASPQIFGVGGGAVGVAIADLNGDGAPDLVVTNVKFGVNFASVLLSSTILPSISGSPATGTIQDDDAPVTITPVAGTTPQSVALNTAFSTNLAVLVKNAAGNPVSNVSVTFTAPGSGASGTFTGSATIITNSSGIATAPTFTANGTNGAYLVTAAATGGGNPSTTFILTNGTVAAFPFAGEYGVTGGSTALATITQIGSALTLNGASTATATITDATHILVNGTDTATYSNSAIVFTSGTFAGQTWTKLDLPADYTNEQGAATHVSQNGSNVTFVNKFGVTAAGFWVSPTELSVPGFFETVSIGTGMLIWQDGSVWNENLALTGNKNGAGTTTITSLPNQTFVLDYVNSVSSPVHLVLTGTSSVIFIDMTGHMSLGTFFNSTQASTPSFPNDIATVSNDFTKVTWQDGTVWTGTAPTAAITVTNFTNQIGLAVHLIQNGTSQLAFIDSFGRLTLGIKTGASTAVTDLYPGDTATFSSGKVTWDDGFVWTQQSGALPLTTTFTDTNGTFSRVQFTSPTTLLGLDGALLGLAGTRVNNQIDWSNGDVWGNFDYDAINALFEMATGYP